MPEITWFLRVPLHSRSVSPSFSLPVYPSFVNLEPLSMIHQLEYSILTHTFSSPTPKCSEAPLCMPEPRSTRF